MLALAAAAAAGCSKPGAQAAEPAAPAVPSVAVVQAARGDLAETLTLAAEFRPWEEIDVHAKVAGYLKSIAVDVGDRVRAGQEIAVLEIPEMQDELEQNRAAVSRAQQEINRAEADLERTESLHEVAHLAAARLQGVINARPNLVAQQDIDDAVSRDRAAEAQVATAKAALASAHQQLEIARANEAKTRTLFGYAHITAPFSGVVTHRYADTGAMIQAGTASQTQAMPVVRLSNLSVLRLTIPVPESAVPRIHLGQPVEVSVASLGRSFPGTVSRFADRLDEQTRTMHTEVDVKNPDLQLVPGMYATASITLDSRRGVLTVPTEAVDRAGEGATVLVVNATRRLEVRPVSLGLETADRVEVASGLREGDLVVVGGRAQLKAGARVEPNLRAVTTEK